MGNVLAAAAGEIGESGTDTCCCGGGFLRMVRPTAAWEKERMVGLSNSHNRGKRGGRLVGERERERWSTARRDRLFSVGVEVGIHRMSEKLILGKNFRIQLVEVVVRTFVGSN